MTEGSKALEPVSTPARGRGRPRDEEKDAAIAEATWRLLAEKGYEALTFESVAELVGCSRSTLYRRFANKAELVEATLGQTSRRIEPRIDDSMSPREVLIAHARALCTYMAGPRGPATLMMSFSAEHHAELAAAIARHGMNEQTFYLREFERARPGTSEQVRDFAFNTLIGTIIFHVAVLRTTLTERQIIRLVDGALTLLEMEPG
ncbi:TetR family transcriptional regulator [Novosphingobium sp. PhB165]|uniref:TetR/AcrR family transcriptional regulator n=1 Tax=Novosphingobium sp. PhB165 TaxID=2485105 RepID=UPI00104D4E86|nr:TetR/AcrR family transcriptional regulator [Novosphingobium sp. PhB165]TCM16563.1 TetR family transcriptional regulator [Novosphingobium sp. PhB165]